LNVPPPELSDGIAVVVHTKVPPFNAPIDTIP
jgi:hypothetical protein